MRKIVLILVVLLVAISLQPVLAQCSICAKTAMQQGEKAATGFNSGIIYLMAAPYLIIGFISYRWWKNHKAENAE